MCGHGKILWPGVKILAPGPAIVCGNGGETHARAPNGVGFGAPSPCRRYANKVRRGRGPGAFGRGRARSPRRRSIEHTSRVKGRRLPRRRPVVSAWRPLGSQSCRRRRRAISDRLSPLDGREFVVVHAPKGPPDRSRVVAGRTPVRRCPRAERTAELSYQPSPRPDKILGPCRSCSADIMTSTGATSGTWSSSSTSQSKCSFSSVNIYLQSVILQNNNYVCSHDVYKA